MRAQVGTQSQLDLLYMWIEEAVSIIREQPWPWNWEDYKGITFAPVVIETGVLTFTHTIGDTYATASGAIPASYMEYTGRTVKLGDEYYKTVDIGHANPLRLYVDRPIVGAETDGVELTLYRTNIAVNASRVKNVSCGNRAKLLRYDPDYFKRRFLTTRQDQLDPATPIAYADHQDRRIDAPLYAPICSDNGGGGVSVGIYHYFYTRVDYESGLESPPGPVLEYNNDHGNDVDVIYGNPSGDYSEGGSSHYLRLYRSEKNPTRNRVPVFRLQTRAPDTPVATFKDAIDGTMRAMTPMYEGVQTVVELLPPPDSDRLAFIITHLDNWGRRAYDEDRIAMGLDNQIIELLRIYLLGLTKLAGKNPAEYRQASAQFRSQMSYLANQARKAASNDLSPENYFNDAAQFDVASAGWVDQLPWSSD